MILSTLNKYTQTSINVSYLLNGLFDKSVNERRTFHRMVDLSSYPFPTYIPNRIIASITSSLVIISFIFWLIQSIQNHFQPVRLIIPLILSHLTILSELMIRATVNITQQNPKIIHMTMTILYTIGQRSMIVANFTCLFLFFEKKSNLFRWIFLAISISIILSDIFMAPAGFLSFESNKIPLSFLFRQLSTSMICFISILFYFIWFWTRTYSIMSYEMIFLLIISSSNCLIITIFLFIMAFPRYYIEFNANEQWFYLFQILPVLLMWLTWSLLHPKRSFYYRNRWILEEEKKSSYVF